ncbi:MAG: phospholipid carrier-dependent glycosyltransferase [Alphaproteobacteria bacterium]|nr:phospholipid carrier-dependent glycosyltransferase [Alphaproteobacteria bacterium]
MEAVLAFRPRKTGSVTILTTGIRPFLVLTALCVALFLPGLASLPPTDRDEARFMQATKQMLETGNVAAIRFQNEPRTKKPIGIHWLQYPSVKYGAQGDVGAVWAYRLPSALAAWLSILCIFALGRKMFDARTGLIAAGLSACTLIMAAEAHLAKTDAALLLTVVAAHFALYQFYRSAPDQVPRMRVALLFWSAIGAGLLIKGPITILVVGATALSLSIADRNIRWLRGLQPEVGIPVALAFVLPWLLASVASGQDNLVIASLAEDFLPKLLGGAEGHSAPPGTHLLVAPITLWPASLLLLPGTVIAWSHRKEPAIRYALAWAATTWLMFELVPTKLPHYILPAVPGLALAAAAALSKSDTNRSRWGAALWTGFTVMIGGGLLWATRAYGGDLVPAVLLALILAAAVGLLWLKRAELSLMIPATAVLSFGLIVGWILPNMHDLALSPRLAASIQNHITPNSPTVALSRYHEPSAVFLLGTETWLTTARNSAAHVAADPLALAVVASDQLEVVREMVTASHGTMTVVGTIKGYNYSKGRAESLSIIQSQPHMFAE